MTAPDLAALRCCREATQSLLSFRDQHFWRGDQLVWTEIIAIQPRAQAMREEQAELEMQPFQYDLLQQDHIRLFRVLPGSTSDDIRCTMHHELQPYIQNNNTGTEYAALSYCWGDPAPVATITLNGRAFPVARNLLDWLKTVPTAYNHDGLNFWVDAICINQSNIPERSVQVRKCGVYTITRAFQTLHAAEKWIEEASDSSDPYDPTDDNKRVLIKNMVNSQENLEAFQEVWKAEYWSRVWILPGVVNASYSIVQSGYLRSQWECLQFISRDSIRPNEIEGLVFMQLMSNNSEIVQGEDKISQRIIFTSDLYTLTMRHCADPRDKLFALASLPAYRQGRWTAGFHIRYDMSNKEVCTAALSYYDQLARYDSKEEKARMTVEERTTEENRVLIYVISWFDDVQPEEYLAYFEKWLRGHVHDSKSMIQLASDELIDCSGPLLSRIISCRADMCPDITDRRCQHAVQLSDSDNITDTSSEE